MKKKDVKRYTKPIQQKIIIGVQLLIFFIYVGFLLIECYKTNNEVVFVNIPIKYNNEQCPTQDVGIRFTKGGKISVKLLDIDPKTGKYKLSHRCLLEKPEGYVEPQRRPRGERGERRQHRDNNHRS